MSDASELAVGQWLASQERVAVIQWRGQAVACCALIDEILERGFNPKSWSDEEWQEENEEEPESLMDALDGVRWTLEYLLENTTIPAR